MTTLYRKYRPQSFSDLAGQEYIVQTIMNEVAMNKVAHAYLFSGPRGVGKTTMARLLAKAVNCEKRKEGQSEPCNECTSCQEITVGRHIDVLEIDAASQTGVDNVRENIIESSQFKPTKAKYKVYIIDEVHMLSTSAFNALLKTLEEPPAHVVFILATTELHKLPATVVSRCQRFTFKRIPFERMREQLRTICEKEKIKVDDDVMTRIIAKSDGGLRDAESLLGQLFSLNRKKITAEDALAILPASDVESVLELVTLLHEKNPSAGLELVRSLSNRGVPMEQFMLDCIETIRTMMVLQATQTIDAEKALYSAEQIKQLKQLTKVFSPGELVSLIDSFLRRRLEIRTAPVPELPLEILIVEYCSEPHGSEPAAPHATASGKQVANSNEAMKQSNNDAVTPSETTAEEKSPKPAGFTASLKQAFDTIAHGHSIATTLEQVQQKWNDVVAKIGESNHSLTFVLKMCSLKQLDHGGLLLSVPYSLHKQKLEEPKSKHVIEGALEQFFSERIPVFCTVESAEQPSSDLSEVAADFGGEIVG